MHNNWNLSDDELELEHSFPSQKNSRSASQFDLYVKTRELQQLKASLQPVALLPKKKRVAWVKENEPFINQMLDGFVDDAQGALSGIHMDAESLKLSAEFVTTLRDVMNTLQGILYDRRTTLTS